MEINNVKVNKTFRLNATHVKPGTLPLNVEFHDENHKFIFLDRIFRNKLESKIRFRVFVFQLNFH